MLDGGWLGMRGIHPEAKVKIPNELRENWWARWEYFKQRECIEHIGVLLGEPERDGWQETWREGSRSEI